MEWDQAAEEFLTACQFKKFDVAKSMVREGKIHPGNINYRNKIGETLLIFVSSLPASGSLIDLLFEIPGLDPNLVGPLKYSALMIAAELGNEGAFVRICENSKRQCITLEINKFNDYEENALTLSHVGTSETHKKIRDLLLLMEGINLEDKGPISTHRAWQFFRSRQSELMTVSAARRDEIGEPQKRAAWSELDSGRPKITRFCV